MRLVLDTNCLIQAIPRNSKYRRIWESFTTGENTLCISNEILEEYEEILLRLTNADIAEYVILTIINNPFTMLVTPSYHFHMIEEDPDDNKFVDCAIACGARFIVTNDHHYDILRSTPFPKVDICSIAEFMGILTQQKNNPYEGN